MEPMEKLRMWSEIMYQKNRKEEEEEPTYEERVKALELKVMRIDSVLSECITIIQNIQELQKKEIWCQ